MLLIPLCYNVSIMQKEESNTSKYLKTKLFYIRFFSCFFIFANVILWSTNFSYFYELIKIGGNFTDAVSSVYDISNTYSLKSFIIIFSSMVLSSFNIALLLEYISMQKVYITNSKNNISDNKKQNTLVSTAVFLSVIASHCASCGAVLFGGLISLSFMSALPYGGIEVGVISLLVLTYVNYNMIKKINNPYVC